MNKGIFLTLILAFHLQLLLSAQGFYIKNYHVLINQSSDGSFDVEEQIQVFFTEMRRGIYREIPLHNQNAQGQKIKIKISDVRVEGFNSKVSTSDGKMTIRIGDPDIYLSGDQEYRIRYKVRNALSQFGDHHEFYWNIIGDQWDCEIHNSSFAYRFPAEWQDQIIQYAAFAGSRGQKDSLQFLGVTGNQIIGNLGRKLYPYQGISLAVAIPDNVLDLTSLQNQQSDSGDNDGIVPKSVRKGLTAVPIALALILLGAWKRLGERDDSPQEIVPKYDIPENMSPAEVGTFYDFRVNRRDIISLLPFWGELGFLKIQTLPGDQDDMYFVRLKEISDDRPAYEKQYFDKLFDEGDTILLSELKNKFYTVVSSASSGIRKEVLERELYHMPSYRFFNTGWMIAAFILLLLLGIATMIVLKAYLAGVGLIVLGITCFVLHFVSPRKSLKGKRIHRHLKGLKNFLEDPQAEKLAELEQNEPGYLYRMFPYALAFGLDQQWAKLFDQRQLHPPLWYDYGPYYGNRTPSFGHFTKNFGAHKIEQVFYSQPASQGSSGGGFSGGYSGGGFGGGGGGSW